MIKLYDIIIYKIENDCNSIIKIFLKRFKCKNLCNMVLFIVFSELFGYTFVKHLMIMGNVKCCLKINI